MAYWEVFLETLLDSIIVLPMLLIVYYLIELIEYKWAVKLQNNRFLRSKASPILATLVGSVPQCGFSVVATDLFAKGIIPVGTLLAVFLATNDEALPLLLTSQSWLTVVILLGVKIVVAVVAGYTANLMYHVMFKRKKHLKTITHQVTVTTALDAVTSELDEHEHKDEHEHDDKKESSDVHHGCCHHDVTNRHFDWLHPLLHSVKIWLFIFVVSLLFGFVADIWVGEARLTAFLGGSLWAQPLLAILVGLIPNCAASAILTQLYLVGGLRLGALLAGLCANAGLGIVFLFRQKHLWREKIFVVTWLVVVSVLVGYGFSWLNF